MVVVLALDEPGLLAEVDQRGAEDLVHGVAGDVQTQRLLLRDRARPEGLLVFLTSASVWCRSSPRPSAEATAAPRSSARTSAAQPGHRREQRQLQAAQRAVGARLDVLLDVARVEQPGEEEAEQHGEEHRAGREAAPARPRVPLGQRTDGLRPSRRPRLEPLLPLLRGLVPVGRLVAGAGGAGGVLGRAPVVARAARRAAGAGRVVLPVAGVARGPAAGRELGHAPVAGHGLRRRAPALVAPAVGRPQVVPDEEVVVRPAPGAGRRPVVAGACSRRPGRTAGACGAVVPREPLLARVLALVWSVVRHRLGQSVGRPLRT